MRLAFQMAAARALDLFITTIETAQKAGDDVDGVLFATSMCRAFLAELTVGIAAHSVRFLDRADAARYLRLTALDFAALENAGALPVPVRLGGVAVWMEADLLPMRNLLRSLESFEGRTP